MTLNSPLRDKVILVVDDEPDVLEMVEEMLDMCKVEKASDYDTAVRLLSECTYDIVILDIMGVDGFKLLEKAASRGFPTVMLTAHALSTAALRQSIKNGAVFLLPKEEMAQLTSFLEDLVFAGGKPIWSRLFEKLGNYFNKRFGSDWKKKDECFRDI